ncbi:MAG: TauD/TfdA dioxygenase family protein [Planctomycetota bacterium]|jgi:taurine dioxygenase
MNLATPLEVLPFDGPCGAEVRGIDAREAPSPEVAEQLKQWVSEYCCILIRDCEMTEEQHLAFAASFGDTDVPWLNSVELDTVSRIKEFPGRPGYTGKHRGVVYFFNGPGYRDETEDSYLQGWHADNSQLQVPLNYAMLNSIEAPDFGYQTWFSNQYLAYDGLEEEFRSEVDKMEILHSFKHVFPHLAPVLWPVAMEHPRTRRRAIYGIPGAIAPGPLGMSKEEGEAVIEKLTAHLEVNQYVYKHTWRKNDLMIWDNRCALHRRGPSMKGQTRIVRRVMATDGHPLAMRRFMEGTASSELSGNTH